MLVKCNNSETARKHATTKTMQFSVSVDVTKLFFPFENAMHLFVVILHLELGAVCPVFKKVHI